VLKGTYPPGSTIHVRVDATDQNVLIDVDDEGPGVPPELRDRLFERFVHGASSQPDETGGYGRGAGLGLAIAQRIVQEHGGRLDIADGSTGGALFRLVLPRVSGR
jgi:signal transduction histidine kinase